MREQNFADKVLAKADSLKLSDELLKERKQIDGITIDGAGSRDLDDAINLEYQQDGYNIQVSISDVSEFVRPGSSLFKEALKRVATNYLNNGNIPMLPISISEDKLSLLEKQLRPTQTFSILLSRELEILKVEIEKTILKSRRRLNYAQADYIIESCPEDPDYQLLNDCYIIARRLLDSRRQRGALAVYDLQNLVYTNEEGQLIRMSTEDAHKSNIIIQEFMILVNRAIAELTAERDYVFLFRNHTVRRATPNREEILEQLKNAVTNPGQLEILKKRSSFWFNRAEYDPVLKGHFGLNLPAYTHITSPLRRVPDLINQGLLKAQLFGSKFTIGSQRLNSIASDINLTLADSLKEKKIFLKEKARSLTRTEIEKNNFNKFIKMSRNDFKRILKEACHSKIMTPDLEEAFSERLANQQIGVEHLSLLLFNVDEHDKGWKKIREEAINGALNIPNFGIQLLNFQVQSGKFTDFQIDVKEHIKGFAARCIAVLENKKVSTPFFSIRKNKKDAQKAASDQFLKCYLSNSFVSSDMTELPPESESNEKEIIEQTNFMETIEENYVGKLGELCIKQKSRSMPVYEFTQEGPADSPTINCECTLKSEDNILQTKGTASKKKIAKQIAAKYMLEEISKYPTEEIIEDEKDDKQKKEKEIIEENYIGLLIDLCLKRHWQEPKFIFSNSGPSHKPTFNCKVSVKSVDRVFTAIGTSSNKKTAKQKAARELLQQIE